MDQLLTWRYTAILVNRADDGFHDVGEDRFAFAATALALAQANSYYVSELELSTYLSER